MLPKKNKVLPSRPTNIVPKKKIAPPVDEDYEEDAEEVDEEEVVDEEVEQPTPKRKLMPRKTVSRREVEEDETEVEDEEEEEPPKRKASVLAKKPKSALAKAFDSVPLTNSSDSIPPGPHEVIIKEAIVRPFVEGRGQSILFRYEFCEERYAGQQMTHWFNIVDANGDAVDWMVTNLRIALAKLGIKITGNELEDTIQEINDQRPYVGVLLKLTYAQGKDGNTYPRFNIQGVCDNEVVDAYRDSVPY